VSRRPTESDEDLLERARRAGEGDTRAFDELVRRYQEKILANCRYLTRSPHDSEDLAQEVFVKAFFGLRHFEGRASFRTWLQRIKVNHCLNHIKKRSGKVLVELDEIGGETAAPLQVGPTAERNVSARDDRRLIAQVLDAMSDTLRIPLVMRELDRMSYQEIAELLGVGLSAIKMRIKRAREEFQRRFREESAHADSLPGESR
jgi:RNA polymerase sigma-70 factor (ECF subfamily)